MYSQRPENGHALHEFSPAHLGSLDSERRRREVQPGTLNNDFLNGCFNWMIPKLYLENGWTSPNIHFKLVVWGSRNILIIPFVSMEGYND